MKKTITNTVIGLTVVLMLSACSQQTGNADKAPSGQEAKTDKSITKRSLNWQEGLATDTGHIESGRKLVYEVDVNEDARVLKAVIQPAETGANVRIGLVEFPDGTTDGPFATEAEIDVTTPGVYKFTVSESTMNGEPFSGEFFIRITKE